MITLKQIKNRMKCCATEKPLTTSKHVNMVQVDKSAKWDYPTWGNVLTGKRDMAVAYVHDDCIDENGNCKVPIKFVVEFAGDLIRYHPIDSI